MFQKYKIQYLNKNKILLEAEAELQLRFGGKTIYKFTLPKN